jgi:hypothetical protein
MRMQASSLVRLWAVGLAVAAAGCTSGGDDAGDDEVDTGRDLDGVHFTEKYSCNETFVGQPAACSEIDAVDELAFVASGGGYEVRDVPDTGFVYTGSFRGDDFEWTATSPDGYTESGSWSFDDARTEFAGSSHYVAGDLTYEGDCNATGVEGVGTPPSPPLPLGCP